MKGPEFLAFRRCYSVLILVKEMIPRPVFTELWGIHSLVFLKTDLKHLTESDCLIQVRIKQIESVAPVRFQKDCLVL